MNDKCNAFKNKKHPLIVEMKVSLVVCLEQRSKRTEPSKENNVPIFYETIQTPPGLGLDPNNPLLPDGLITVLELGRTE